MTKNYQEQSVQLSERIHILDILRGFAVFGILSVNIMAFSLPNHDFGQMLSGGGNMETATWYDQLALLFNEYFTEGKFYIIFSFLFGLGFSVQLARAEAKGNDILSFYPRRLLWLFVMGFLHSLIWWGDVLRLYAILGFGLLVFRKFSTRVLLGLAVLFFCFSGVVAAYPSVFGDGGASQISGIDGVANSLWLGVIQMGPVAMTMFLLGRVIGRTGFFGKLQQHKSVLKHVVVYGLIIAVTMKLVAYFFVSEYGGWETMFKTLSDIGLSATYVGVLSLLSLEEKTSGFLERMSCVGRMALTNYIAQSVICVAFFKLLDLEGKVDSAWLLLITFVIYALQLLYSKWWLKHFRYGVLEWLWRSLTYRKMQKFRL